MQTWALKFIIVGIIHYEYKNKYVGLKHKKSKYKHLNTKAFSHVIIFLPY